ncbi:MAG: N-acyl-D-amino-acid deacylase family protein, partial [Haliscomenobacter sp.]
HHKAIGIKMWGASKKTLAMVDSARARGLDVAIDQYPYTASFTGISVLIPSWALEGNPVREFTRRCEDPLLRDSIKQGIIFNLLNDRGGGDLRRIQFGSFDWKPELNGKTLHDWALQEGLEPNVENGAELVIQAQMHRGAGCIFHAISEEDVRRIMQHPQTMIASDGRLSQPGKDHPHPRAYGTFPRVLGQYVREEKVLSLEQALFKMTAQPALKMGLHDRGFLRKGYYADLTLFDPATVRDQSTFEAPHQYATGIPYVILNGKVVVDNGEYRDLRAGKALRRQ